MAKIYTPITWVDEVLAGAAEYELKDDSDTVIYNNCEIALATAVSVAGTPVNAANLNNIEDGLDAIDTLVSDAIDDIDALEAAAAVKIPQIWLKKDTQPLIIEDKIAGKAFIVTEEMNGWALTDFDVAVEVVSSSGLPEFEIENLTTGHQMLSTNATIDASEFTSYTAATPPVINATYRIVSTGDRLAINCVAAGSGAMGASVMMKFEEV